MNIPPKVNSTELLLDKLGIIGAVKANLPMTTKALLNGLGLYVQLRYIAGKGYLQSGGEFRSYFIASGIEGEPITNFKVESFDNKTWDNRFARLVWPTYEIALYIGGPLLWGSSVVLPDGRLSKLNEITDPILYEQVNNLMVNRVEVAVEKYKGNGDWLGVAYFCCEKCNRSLYIWEIQNKVCPCCNALLISHRQS